MKSTPPFAVVLELIAMWEMFVSLVAQRNVNHLVEERGVKMILISTLQVCLS